MRALLLAATLLALASTASAQEGAFDAMIHAYDENGVSHQFSPIETEVVPGGAVAVMNVGTEPHSVRSVDGLFETDAVPADPNQQALFTAPTTPGRYAFYCPYHASASTPTGEGMTGWLVVTEGAAPAPTMTPSPTPTPAGDAKNETPVPALAILAGVAVAALLLRRR